MARTTSPSPRSATPPWLPRHHLHTALYHGCLRKHATAMLRGGISHAMSAPDTDFGLGFYTTTLLRQAEDWAYIKHKAESLFNRGLPDFRPVVVWFRVPRADLAGLDALSFVRGDYDAEEFWSFVQHCRSSVRATKFRPAVIHHHERDASGLPTWYDLVSGPVAAFWPQRSAMLNADQYSFHTQKAVDVLNNLVRHGANGVDYGVDNVTV